MNGVFYFVVGGLAQLACSARAFRSFDHFGATVFGFFATFWAIRGLELMLPDASHASIDEWHTIVMVIANFMLLLVAPLVNAYYVAALGTILVAALLELTLSLLGSDDDYDGEDGSTMDKLRVRTGCYEIILCLVTTYGAANAILHGIHQRWVLPGFDDAVIETVLWKREALHLSYTQGKFANPKPLMLISLSLGLVGIIVDLYDDHTIPQVNYSVVFGGATFAVLSLFASIFHALRHEPLLAVSATTDAMTLAIHTYGVVYDKLADQTAFGLTFIALALIRILYLVTALKDDKYAVDIAIFGMWPVCLILEGIQEATSSTRGEFITIITVAAYCILSVLSMFGGIAELANAVAQKMLVPLGSSQKLFKRMSRCFSTLSLAQCRVSDESELTLAELSNSSDSDKDLEDHHNAGASPLESQASWEKIIPGERDILGQSDFQSPLFVILLGLSLYSSIMVIALYTNSTVAVGHAILVNGCLIQPIALLMSVSRGQTSFGFLAFTYAMEAVVLLSSPTSDGRIEEDYHGIVPLFVGVLVLQLCWLAASFRVFTWLSVVTSAHVVAILCFTLSLSGAASGFRSTLQTISATAFEIMFVLGFYTLGLLMGGAHLKLQWCKRHLALLEAPEEGSSDGTEDREQKQKCPVGWSHDRRDFEECVRILRNGGVCCIPTDTVYCLACASNRPDAIKRIYEIKNRPNEKPLSLWVGSINDILTVGPDGMGWGDGEVQDTSGGGLLFTFMKHVWPGPVSLVVSRGSGEWLNRLGIVSSTADMIGTKDSIALRVPNSTLTVSLLMETGPLVITSANPSGQCDCTHHNKVDDHIAKEIDFLLADGPSPMTIASTVMDVREIGSYDIDKEDSGLYFYRVGCVPRAEIFEILDTSVRHQRRMQKHLEYMHVSRNLLSRDVVTSKLNPFMSVMASMDVTLRYDAWTLYCLVERKGFKSDSSEYPSWLWEEVASDIDSSLQRVVRAFQTGAVSYMDHTHKSDIIIPVHGHDPSRKSGKSDIIFGVLELHRAAAPKEGGTSSSSFSLKELEASQLISRSLSNIIFQETTNGNLIAPEVSRREDVVIVAYGD